MVETFGLATIFTAGGLLGPGIGQPSKVAATICAVVATTVGQTGLGTLTIGAFTNVFVLVALVFDVPLEVVEFAQITTWLPTTAEPEENAPDGEVVQAACAEVASINGTASIAAARSAKGKAFFLCICRCYAARKTLAEFIHTRDRLKRKTQT